MSIRFLLLAPIVLGGLLACASGPTNRPETAEAHNGPDQPVPTGDLECSFTDPDPEVVEAMQEEARRLEKELLEMERQGRGDTQNPRGVPEAEDLEDAEAGSSAAEPHAAACLHLEAGRHGDAEAKLREALSLTKKYQERIEILEDLATSLEAQGRLEEAEQAREEAEALLRLARQSPAIKISPQQKKQMEEEAERLERELEKAEGPRPLL